MSGTMMEDEDLLRAAEYALAIVRRTEELAATQGVDPEYQSALTSLTGYVAALQAASMSSRRPPNPLQGPEPTPSSHPQARTLSMEVRMSPQEPKGPFCQSCAMPLRAPEDFGTDQAGYRVNDFCRHCFADGAFTEPAISMEAMLDRCVDVMAGQGIMPAAQARVLMADTLPRLQRWRMPAGAR